MKIFVLAILILSFASRPHSQSIAIELGYPTAWPGLDNSVTIVAEGVPCQHIYVSTDNGIIRPRDTDCTYGYIPKKVGESHFFIYRVADKDTVLIEKRRIIVRRWPDQPAEFARKTSGTVSLGEFLAQPGVVARISGFDMSGNHEVKSYEITVVRNGEIILKLKNTGARFESENSKKLEIMRVNDEIIFDNILAFMPGEESPRKLNDIRIKIQN